MFRLNSHFRGQLFLKNNTTFYKFPSLLLILNLQLKAIALIKDSCGLLCGTRHILFVEKPNKKMTSQTSTCKNGMGKAAFGGATCRNCEAMCYKWKNTPSGPSSCIQLCDFTL